MPKAYNQEIIDKAIYEYQHTDVPIDDICKKIGISKSTFFRRYTGPKRGERNKGRKYFFNISKIQNDSPDKYYWLGFIAADGAITGGRTLAIELKATDKEHLIKFRNFLESNALIKERVNNTGCHCVKIAIYSLDLVDYLKEYNIVPNKSLIYQIPIDKIPKQYIYDFARGMIDGDGSIQIQNDKQLSLTFCSGNQICVEQMKSILDIHNIISYGSGTYHFQVKGNHIAKAVLDKIYQNSKDENRLSRKYNIYAQTLN